MYANDLELLRVMDYCLTLLIPLTGRPSSWTFLLLMFQETSATSQDYPTALEQLAYLLKYLLDGQYCFIPGQMWSLDQSSVQLDWKVDV